MLTSSRKQEKMRPVSKRTDSKSRRPAQINAVIDPDTYHRAKVNLAKKKKTVSDAVRECFERIAK